MEDITEVGALGFTLSLHAKTCSTGRGIPELQFVLYILEWILS